MSSTNTTTPSTMNASKTAVKRVAKKSDAPSTPVVAVPSATATATAAPVATPVASASPVAEAKKTVKRAAKAPSASATVAPVTASSVPVVGAEPVVDGVSASPSVEDTWQTDLKSVQSQLAAVREATTAALTALKGLERRFTRELKEARKNRRKVRKELAEGEKAAPSEFEKPRPISDELGLFLGLGKSAQISRAEVTRSISNYVKSNGLGNGQKIAHNAALRTLLGISETDELTIFNMQKYLNRHYLKPAVAVTASTGSTSSTVSAVAPKA